MKSGLSKLLICLAFVFLGGGGNLLACDVCRRNQPEILQDIAHGVGPQQLWDDVIVGIAALLVTVVLVYSVKLLWFPKEHDHTHIKYLIKDL